MIFFKSILRADFCKIYKFFLNIHFYIAVAFVALDHVFVQQLFYILLNNKLRLEKIDPKSLEHVTANRQISKASGGGGATRAGVPHRNDNNAEEANAFVYIKATCTALKEIKGMRNHFQICYPPITNETGKLAYFINVKRDVLFEKNFKTMLFKDSKLKIYTNATQLNGTNAWQYADVVENTYVKNYTDKNEDENGQRIKGIKDLMDEQDNYFMVEFLKYEMENSTDPLVFSISTSVHVPHLLLRLQHFPFEELRYLIKRLLYSHYYPYSVQRDQKDEEILYVTLAKNMYMNKYLFSSTEQANWPRNLVNRTTQKAP